MTILAVVMARIIVALSIWLTALCVGLFVKMAIAGAVRGLWIGLRLAVSPSHGIACVLVEQVTPRATSTSSGGVFPTAKCACARLVENDACVNQETHEGEAM